MKPSNILYNFTGDVYFEEYTVFGENIRFASDYVGICKIQLTGQYIIVLRGEEQITNTQAVINLQDINIVIIQNNQKMPLIDGFVYLNLSQPFDINGYIGSQGQTFNGNINTLDIEIETPINIAIAIYE